MFLQWAQCHYEVYFNNRHRRLRQQRQLGRKLMGEQDFKGGAGVGEKGKQGVQRLGDVGDVGEGRLEAGVAHGGLQGRGIDRQGQRLLRVP